MDGGAWWAAVHGVAKSQDTTEQLHLHFSLSCIGEGNGNPLQCSCLENPRDGGAWWAAIYGVAQSRTRLKLLSSSSSLRILSSFHRAHTLTPFCIGNLTRYWGISPSSLPVEIHSLLWASDAVSPPWVNQYQLDFGGHLIYWFSMTVYFLSSGSFFGIPKYKADSSRSSVAEEG